MGAVYVPKTIVFGSGLSAQWVRRDFNGDRVAIVSKGPLPETSATRKIKSNVTVYYSSEIKYNEADSPSLYKIFNHNGEELFEGMAAYATGLRHATEITAAVPDVNYHDLDAVLASGSKEIHTLNPEETWIAANDTPRGSLSQAVQLWMARTQNFELLDLSSFHTPTFPESFTTYMTNHSIILGVDFYNTLEIKLTRDNTPCEAETVDIFLTAFKETEGDTSKQNQFKRALLQFPALQSSGYYAKKDTHSNFDLSP